MSAQSKLDRAEQRRAIALQAAVEATRGELTKSIVDTAQRFDEFLESGAERTPEKEQEGR